LGTLSIEKHPQITCDLRFEKEFVLSHNSSTTSVFVCGYKKKDPMFEFDSSKDEINSNEELEPDEIGEELKPGSKVSYNAGQGYVIHLSQAALGETKKGSENVVVYVEVDDKKSVIGTLCVEKHPQIMCDLIFEKDFELSHSSKTTSVFLCGYRLPIPIIGSDSGEDEISSNEELETDEILMKLRLS